MPIFLVSLAAWRRVWPLLLAFCLFFSGAKGQKLHPLDFDTLPNKKRARIVGFSLGGLYAASYGALGAAWYGQQGLSGFRWFDDNHEWKQMDKVGHAYGAYQESRATITLLKWCGAKRKTVLILGGLAGFIMQSPIEIFDGLSPEYGASAGDLVANATGSALAILNEGLWQEQRIQLKFSFFPSSYASQYPVLGTGGSQLIKDYNGQTYWLSFRIHSFLPESKFKDRFPRWLNLCFGYGAEGLIGGYGRDPQAAIDAREYRQFYVGLDIDLANIPTRKRGLKLLLGMFNSIRLPLPAVEFSPYGVRFHPLFF